MISLTKTGTPTPIFPFHIYPLWACLISYGRYPPSPRVMPFSRRSSLPCGHLCHSYTHLPYRQTMTSSGIGVGIVRALYPRLNFAMILP